MPPPHCDSWIWVEKIFTQTKAFDLAIAISKLTLYCIPSHFSHNELPGMFRMLYWRRMLDKEDKNPSKRSHESGNTPS
jgi:hypothetical protein